MIGHEYLNQQQSNHLNNQWKNWDEAWTIIQMAPNMSWYKNIEWYPNTIEDTAKEIYTTAPMHKTAWYFPNFPSLSATRGTSKLPGTHTT